MRGVWFKVALRILGNGFWLLMIFKWCNRIFLAAWDQKHLLPFCLKLEGTELNDQAILCSYMSFFRHSSSSLWFCIIHSLWHSLVFVKEMKTDFFKYSWSSWVHSHFRSLISHGLSFFVGPGVFQGYTSVSRYLCVPGFFQLMHCNHWRFVSCAFSILDLWKLSQNSFLYH